MAQQLGQEVAVCLAGSNVLSLAEDLLTYGVDRVYYYDYPELEYFRIEPYTAIVANLVEANGGDPSWPIPRSTGSSNFERVLPRIAPPLQ